MIVSRRGREHSSQMTPKQIVQVTEPAMAGIVRRVRPILRARSGAKRLECGAFHRFWAVTRPQAAEGQWVGKPRTAHASRGPISALRRREILLLAGIILL